MRTESPECPTGDPQNAVPIGHPPEGDEMPPRTLAVAENASAGAVTGRVGAGLNGRASPEMRPGSHHDDWAATPQAAAQSLRKTPMRHGLVARSYQKSINELVRIQPGGSEGSYLPAARPSQMRTSPAGPPRTRYSRDSRQTS